MPVIGNKLFCPDCKHEQPQINLIRCKLCGCDLGAPNVNEASTDDETNALNERYDYAVGVAKANGHDATLTTFEQFFQDKVQAVINMDFDVLQKWLLDEDKYSSYYRLVGDGIRDIATPENDRRRNIIDGFLFGSYGKDIIFAALSLNNSGLLSYGSCTVSLHDSMISKRATILEENSYNFVMNHTINLEVVKIPKGYRAIWGNKQKLAVAKIYEHVNSACKNEDFCNFVLYSEGERKNEEFMEVHIFSDLSAFAANNIYIPITKDRKKRYRINLLIDKYPGQVFLV